MTYWKVILAISGKMLIIFGLGIWLAEYLCKLIWVFVVLGLLMTIPATLEFCKMKCSCCKTKKARPKARKVTKKRVVKRKVAKKKPKRKTKKRR